MTMPRALAALFACLLLAAPAAADMYQDGSNRKLPDARYNIGSGNACNPVTDFGADPTGVADATTAINSCAAVTKNGQRVNVYLPAGSYRLTNQINIGGGQILSGDSRTTTNLMVKQDFSPSATGVINFQTGGDSGSEIRDLGIKFEQPADQALRANYANLGTCTSGPGGTGCKYPPAVKCLPTSGRSKIKDVRVALAWQGVAVTGTNPCLLYIENLEMSAIDTGLLWTGSSLDFNHIKGFHFWAYDMLNTTPIYTNVFKDGGTFAAKFGEINGLNVSDFTTFHGRVLIDHANFWAHFTNLMLDGNDATLEINNAQFLQITNIYESGAATGFNPNCQVQVAGGTTIMANVWLQASGTTANNSALCMSGGKLTVIGGGMTSNNGQARAIKQTGGRLFIEGVTFGANTVLPYTVPLIDVQAGGSISLIGNRFPIENTVNVGSVKIAADAELNYLTNNNTRDWKAVFDFPLTTAPLGYYDLGDQVFPLTGLAPSFATPGDSVFTVTNLAGNYFLRGSYIEGDANLVFNTNAFTTAAGNFQIGGANMPPPVAGVPSCYTGIVSMVTLNHNPGCNVSTVDSLGVNQVFTFHKINSGAAQTVLGTAEVTASKTNALFRFGWRYRFR